jgi:hypothetical protein
LLDVSLKSSWEGSVVDAVTQVPYEFMAVVDRYQRGWESALQKGNATALEPFFHADYQQWFGHMNLEQPQPLSLPDVLQGLNRFTAIFKGSIHIAQNLHVRMRTDTDAVVSYERLVLRSDHLGASTMVLQTWRRRENTWRIVRECVESLDL